MTKECIKCKWEIVELNLSEEQKLEIWGLLNQDLKLFAIDQLRGYLNLSLKDAKGVLQHLNKDFGKCIRCKYEELDKENMECPKCKAFNYNLKIETSFDRDFCVHLEFSLDFDELDDERVKGFWCDGVDHNTFDFRSLSKSNMKKNRFLKTNAWIGKGGQGVYEMTIYFGKQSIENFMKNESLVDCIPKGNFKEWIKIEPTSNKIEVRLN